MMNVNGSVVAISARMQLHPDDGMLLKIYNDSMNIHFHVFVQIQLFLSWKKIVLHHSYIFRKLEIALLKLCEDFKEVVFKATYETTFNELVSKKSYQFTTFNKSSNALLKNGSPFSFQDEKNSHLHLISYKGCITKVKDFGVYELDTKVLLYTTFLKNVTMVSSLKESCEIYVSNAHLISGYQEKKILVCCGLSSVRLCNLSQKEVIQNFDLCPSVYLFHKYSLSIFDILWIQELLSRLDIKFFSVIPDDCYPFLWDFNSLDSILQLFSCSKCLPDINQTTAEPPLAYEFISYPHTCTAFSEHILDYGCSVPFIADIIQEAETRATWNKASKSWRFSTVSSENYFVLFGILHLSENGNFYISDNKGSIHCIFSDSLQTILDNKKIVCDCINLKTSHLIASNKYDIVFEETIHNDVICSHRSYLNISWTSVFLIMPLSKNLNSEFTGPKNVVLERSMCNISNIQSVDTYSREANPKMESYVESPMKQISDQDSIFIQSFLVICKLWSVHKAQLFCSQLLVVLLGCTAGRKESAADDTFCFSDEDLEFAYLIDKMEGLELSSRSRQAQLLFDKDVAHKCVSLQTGHIYKLSVPGHLSRSHFHNLSDVVKISKDMNIRHSSSDCKVKYSPNYCGAIDFFDVHSLLNTRKLIKLSAVRGIVAEKFYEQGLETSLNGSSENRKHNLTLCILLQDINSKDCIRVYIPHHPQNLYGLLPGALVELFGFFCICSQKGYLYLKASNLFGIEIKSWNNLHKNIGSINFKPSMEQLIRARFVQLCTLSGIDRNVIFKSLCTVLKIVSAEIFLACQSCNCCASEYCRCLSPYTIKCKSVLLIDDGTDQVFVHCNEETLKIILRVKDFDWEHFVSFTRASKQPLKYSQKMDFNDFDSLSYMNQVFYVICTSGKITRKVVLFCHHLKEKGNWKQVCCCIDVEEPNSKNVMMDMYAKILDKNKSFHLETK